MPAILAIYVAVVILGSCLTGFLLARKRFGLSVFVFLLLLPAALVGWYQATRIDMVAAWLYPSDTVYSQRFNPQQFRSVTEGMRQRELLALLGQPFERRAIAERREYWYFSRQGPRSENYWNFIVIVDPVAGKVVGRIREFYTD